MTEHYTRATMHTHKPAPCENCGSRRVVVAKWTETSTFGDVEDQFIPATVNCQDCRNTTPAT